MAREIDLGCLLVRERVGDEIGKLRLYMRVAVAVSVD